ncbi:12612_t:CDS:2 [Acaulospora colombiana]|uniref:12612_t:CDS:1 n=1 Tax=Acaulospora colombiana TaxID=27376 RepID=A0ACA9LXB3_9GLOM|nr:12612_t:CDS:2 [Acaulospora colombiana]
MVSGHTAVLFLFSYRCVQSEVLPTRLFELKPPFTPKDGKLYYGVLHKDARNLPQPLSYCTVSFVWGESPSPVDVESVPWPVPISSQAKLDFILESCSNQGFKYVWLDILCINQRRDDEAAHKDQAAEIPKMETYYANSTATIVFGLNYENFAINWSKVASVVDIWLADRDGKSLETRDAVWEGLAGIDDVMQDSWFWRVWTLQEAVVPIVSSRRLVTSSGTDMALDILADLIDWINSQLSMGTLDGETPYDWVHPGEGVVVDRDWWNNTEYLKEALNYKSVPIHPLSVLNITRERGCARAVDRLRGAYAILDNGWHIDALEAEKEASRDTDLSMAEHYERIYHVTWQMTVDKYIKQKIPDCVPLVSMRITQFPSRTWDCTPWLPESITNPEDGTWNPARWLKWKDITESTNDDWGIDEIQSGHGEIQMEYGRYINETAELVLDDGPTKGSLRLKASAIERIAEVEYGASFGDGSGELSRMFYYIIQLQRDYDISAIVVLLLRAAEHTLRHRVQGEEEDKYFTSAKTALGNGDHRRALEYLCFLQLRDGNAFSTGFREVFNGWDRWIVTTEDDRSYLAWFPWRDNTDRLSKCHLIWTCPGHNEWALLGEPTSEAGQYRKVGVVFVDSSNDKDGALVTIL